MRKGYAALVFIALASCNSDKSSGPALKGSAIVGHWTANVAAASGCWPAFSYTFDVTSEQVTSGAITNAVDFGDGQWFIGGAGPLQYTGTIRLDGKVSTLKFWKHVLVAGGGVDATLNAAGTQFSGTFYDEGNAFALADGCTATVSITKG